MMEDLKSQMKPWRNGSGYKVAFLQQITRRIRKKIADFAKSFKIDFVSDSLTYNV